MILIMTIWLTGCELHSEITEMAWPEELPTKQQIAERYEQITLKSSDAAEVLDLIHTPEYELLSQSKSVIASSGVRKQTQNVWVTMVGFEEDTLSATSKYLLIMDENPKTMFTDPRAYMILKCQAVISEEVLSEPYADGNAKRIAVLENLHEVTLNNFDEIKSDNKEIQTSKMLVNQTFSTVLTALEASPAKAIELKESEGFDFTHPSLDKGNIKMTLENDVVDVDVRLGSVLKKIKLSREREIPAD